jgi:hypothetical protein
MIQVNSGGSDNVYAKSLEKIQSVERLIKKNFLHDELQNPLSMAVAKKFVLESLHQSSFLSKFKTDGNVMYKDLVESIFNSLPNENDDKDSEYYA